MVAVLYRRPIYFEGLGIVSLRAVLRLYGRQPEL